MPGRKQEGHREALLRNSLESSSSAGPTGDLTMAHSHLSRLVETETPLPNTVSSGQVTRLEAERIINRPEERSDTITVDSTIRRIGPNLQPSLTPPIPSQPRLSPTNAHPLSLDLNPVTSTAANVISPFSEYYSPTAPGQGGAGALGQAAETPCARSASGLQMLHEGSGGFAPECRICLLSEPPGDLVTPCHCTGSLAYAHMTCLKTWVMEKRSVYCELCGAMYKEPYGSELAASIPPAPQPPALTSVRRITSPDGRPIIILPVGVNLGPRAMGPLLEHHPSGPHYGGPALAAGMSDPRDLEPRSLCEWRNMWSYALILLLLLFAIIYVTVISKNSKQEPWMMTLWQVLLVVLPIYLVLRVAFDLYRHRLAQQLAAANLQVMAIANQQANAAADAAAAAGQTASPQREVIITRAGNRLLVVQRLPPL